MTATISPQLAYILDNPDDDTARLIYADHLEEQGESARAEFIRVSIALTEVKSECGSENGDYLCRSLTCPLCPLIRRMNAAWLEIPLTAKPPRQRVDAHETFPGFAFRIPCGPVHTAPVAHFNRGFIEIVQCRIRQWLDVADAATGRHPIREVIFTSHPQDCHLQFAHDRNVGLMRLSVRSHHAMSTVVRAGITLDGIDDEIMRLFETRWPKITFHWNAFATGG